MIYKLSEEADLQILPSPGRCKTAFKSRKKFTTIFYEFGGGFWVRREVAYPSVLFDILWS
jgi:hypothetical protein